MSLLDEPKGYPISQQSTSLTMPIVLEGGRMKKENHGLKYLRNGRINRGQRIK